MTSISTSAIRNDAATTRPGSTASTRLLNDCSSTLSPRSLEFSLSASSSIQMSTFEPVRFEPGLTSAPDASAAESPNNDAPADDASSSVDDFFSLTVLTTEARGATGSPRRRTTGGDEDAGLTLAVDGDGAGDAEPALTAGSGGASAASCSLVMLMARRRDLTAAMVGAVTTASTAT